MNAGFMGSWLTYGVLIATVIAVLSGPAFAAVLAFLLVLGAAGGFLLSSVDGGMRLLDRLYAEPASGRPQRR